MKKTNYYTELFNVYHTDYLTKEEEDALIIKIKEGDKQAIEKLVNSNLGFILKNAQRGLRLSHKFTIDDYFQVAALGFVYSLSRFDRSKGSGLRSYAVIHMMKEIFYLAKHSNLIRIPMYLWDKKRENKDDKYDKDECLYNQLGVGIGFLDAFEYKEAAEVEEQKPPETLDIHLVKGMMKSLEADDNRLYTVIKYRFLERKIKTHREIAKILGCGHGSVGNFEKRGLEYLKAYLGRHNVNGIGDLI